MNIDTYSQSALLNGNNQLPPKKGGEGGCQSHGIVFDISEQRIKLSHI